MPLSTPFRPIVLHSRTNYEGRSASYLAILWDDGSSGPDLESDKKSENLEPDAGSNTGSEGDDDHSGLQPVVFHLPMLSSIEQISYTEYIEYKVTSFSCERRNISEEVCSCVRRRGLRSRTRNTPNKSLKDVYLDRAILSALFPIPPFKFLLVSKHDLLGFLIKSMPILLLSSLSSARKRICKATSSPGTLSYNERRERLAVQPPGTASES